MQDVHANGAERSPAAPLPELADLFEIRDNAASSPVILHAPHGGRTIPERFLGSFIISPEQLESEKNALTDHHTAELVRDVPGVSHIANGLSRFAIDVERFPDEREEKNAVGMGVLYTHGSWREEIRRPTADDTTALMAYFAFYSARFTALVDATLAAHGRAVILDVHSYNEHALPHELHSGGERPELCVGFEPFHSSEAVLDCVARAFPALRRGTNHPFAGSYVPLRHYRIDARVSSVMLEIRRDTYLDESTLELRPSGWSTLTASLRELARALA